MIVACVIDLMHAGGRDKPTLQKLICYKYDDESGVKQRIHIIKELAARWKAVGLVLDFDTCDLNNIERDKNNVEDCCIELMGRWLQGTVQTKQVTWETLLEAMEDAQFVELAQKLKGILSH